MHDFDSRWQELAALARKRTGQEDEPPFGFAARIAARAFSTNERSDEEFFGRLLSRMLAGPLGLLILCTALEARHLREPRPLETGVENTVAQLVWAL